MHSASPRLLIAGLMLLLLAMAILLAGGLEASLLASARLGALPLDLAQCIQDLASPVAVILALAGVVVGLGSFTTAN